MSTPVERHALLLEQLHSSICLLGLLAERPANLDGLLLDHKEAFLEKGTSDNADSGEGYPEEDLEDVEIISAEDIKDRDTKALRSIVLDRLAETLARYKSDRAVKKGPILDPKHVSSTMMIIDEEHNMVKILCAKNEGLDQRNSTDDTDFLSCWKACMERISREGVAVEEDKFYMLDIILKYQRPRITYYLNKLRKALRVEQPAQSTTQDKRPRLSDEWLRRLPVLHTRSWIDDNENEFQFSVGSLDEAENISRAALSAQSLKNIKNEVDRIFRLIDQVSSLDETEDDHLSRAILKQLLPLLFSVWRSPRFQASIKSRLHARFEHLQHSEKRQNEAFTALKFLCRVYYSVDVFIQAAQSMPIFKSVECIPVPLQPAFPTKATPKPVRAQETPLETAESLGLYVHGIGWLHHLEKIAIKNSFRKLRGEKQLMMMPMVAGNDGLLITDLYEKPGFVSVMGGSLSKPKEMSCEDAEIYKENHIRGKFELEKTDEMPPKQGKFAPTCRRCHRPSSLRCSSCRSDYCSRACQKKHWSRHVFVCKLAKRPNDVDYLRIFIRKWSHAIGYEWREAQILSELYSDDDLCKTFGFNNCAERHDVGNLLCFYTHMTSKLSTNGVQVGVDEGNLGAYLAFVVELIQLEGKETYRDCTCFTWFLHRRSFIDCVIPNWAGDFAYQAAALRRLEYALSIEDRDDDAHPLSTSEREVLALYSILFRDFNNIPGPLTSKWLQFGFCFCTNRGQSMELAKLYVQLAKCGASLEEIARAYEEHTLPILMRRRGLNISLFKAKGIAFHRPDLEELGIYRLITEVSHTLSGRFCYCHLTRGYCHPKFESHLSRESDGDYGFHGTNTWERWQLFNFYKHVFGHPNFDARKMQEAKRNPDKEKLDQYLDSLVPDFRKNIADTVLGDIMFPKLKAGVRFPNGRPPCWCVMHDTIAPEGLGLFPLSIVSQLRAITQGDKEDALEDSNLIGT
ncbi:hypothetical protein LSUB1_G005388 [Lachnellula subtilissima]|uniref:MYND-type domain-containing protein n=1 Tax=Lachnellula subtilissima TaxID=602034 RepID=A0A8H8RKS3_9HELO|nr:hypothetical protein LSUB1_G005388 [Lachnellula subtilissima]